VFERWRKDGVDHCDRAAEVVPELLGTAGFPASKVEAVQEAVRQHMYYRPDAKRPEAVVLHDADTLDFLGAIGVARVVSLTSRHRWASDLAGAVKTLQGFHDELPGKVVTAAGRRVAAERAAEGKALLAALRAETLDGKAY
jgi:HD superfamily phosphodiesterase